MSGVLALREADGTNRPDKETKTMNTRTKTSMRPSMALTALTALFLAQSPPARAQCPTPGTTWVPNVTYDGNDADLSDCDCDVDPVQAGNQCTLRAALQNACHYGGVQQVLLFPTTYTLSLVGTEDLGAWGDLDIHANGLNALFSIELIGAPGLTFIDASGLFAGPERVLHITSSVPGTVDVILTGVGLTGGQTGTGAGLRQDGGRVLLDDVSIQNNVAGLGGGVHTSGELIVTGGNIAGNDALATLGSGKGGGLYADAGANVTVNGGDISGNFAGSGGAVSIQAGAAVALNGTLLALNTCGGSGGAIRNHGTLTLDGASLHDNNAGGSGGALAQDQPGVLSAERTDFRRNGAQFGGAVNVAANSVSASFLECTFDENTAAFLGGGIAANAATTVERSTVSRNVSQGFAAGGIYALGPLELINSTVGMNTADTGSGGGLYLTGSGPHQISACTIAFNSAQAGAGLFANAPSDFKSTILSDNVDTSGLYNNFDASPGAVFPTSHGTNLDSDGTCAFVDPSDQAGTSGLALQAQLGPLANNGGPTETFALLPCGAAGPGSPGSPAIDRGDCVALNGLVLSEDQRREPRAAACDVGAYEYRMQITTFCDGASLTDCPCGNTGDPASGCDNAQGTGGVLATATAVDVVACRATLTGTGFPAMSAPTSIVIRADTLEPTPQVFGDGLRCIGTPVVRLAATFASGGSVVHGFANGAMAAPGAKHYQLWYRNTPVMFCDAGAAFNLSNGVTIYWP